MITNYGRWAIQVCWSILVLLANTTNLHADGGFVVVAGWDSHFDINEPNQKAIILFDGGREDLMLQVKYAGHAEEFGWIIPLPAVPTVTKGSIKCFYELSKLTYPEGNYATVASLRLRKDGAPGQG